ncbi:hypothetical protein OXX80_011350 [Metschnikowia pulcherrima]
MKSKKKPPAVLDLSETPAVSRKPEFEVSDYDYELRQGKSPLALQEDLELLLSEQEGPSLESENATGRKKKEKIIHTREELMSLKPTPSSFSAALRNRPQSARLSEVTTSLSHMQLDLAGAPSSMPRSQASSSGKQGKQRSQRSKPSSGKSASTDITKDLDGIDFSSEDECADVMVTKSLPGSKGTRMSGDFEDLDAVSSNASTKRRRRRNRAKKSSAGSSVPPESRETTPQAESLTEEAPKSKSKAKKRASTEPETEDETSSEKYLSVKMPNRIPRTDLLRPVSAQTPPPSSSDSRPGDFSPFSRLASAKAAQVKQLPQVQPVSTIFGLSHEQIYKTKLTDVKVKTIVNVPMSKMCKNALTFVMAESEGLFMDTAKRAQFVDLCTKVALYEAPGFNEVTKRIPELLKWVPLYEPFTLQHTKTNLTTSNKKMHRNSLDYTVFAFFGHIILWANELQHAAKLPEIVDKFRLGISRAQILNSLGGYHLWDRLRRDKTINTKRWKHIQKFRQTFAFEEHQFVLILRCMNLGIQVC